MDPAQPPAECLHNPLASLVGYQLRQASLAITNDLNDRLGGLSLTLINLSVLLMIEANPGVTQSDLCRRLGIKRANMTPLTFQFEERSLIERQPTDGRSQGLRLTPKGQQLAASARQIVAENEAYFLSALTLDEQVALRAALVSLETARTMAAATMTS